MNNSFISRRELLKYGLKAGAVASLSSSLLVTSCSKKGVGRKHPNVILISIDTLRADHLACYGYKQPTSPSMDKLASGGLLFEDVSSPSPWTLPAHVSLLTGLYPNRHGVKTHLTLMPMQLLVLAEVLKDHGFTTAAIVNSHYVSQRYGFERGFNEFIYVPEQLSNPAPSQVERKALKWLSTTHKQPFFLFLHYYDVHSDYCALPEYSEKFVRPYSGPVDGSTAQLINFREEKFTLSQRDVQHLTDLYDASILQMDDGIARLLLFLEKKDLLDDTVIILTSDHGEEFLEHGGVLHGRTQYQELMHVPLIIRGPGLPAGRRIKQIASLADLMPTVLAMLHISVPPGLDGIDLTPLWQGSGELPLRFVFGEADHNNVENDIKRAVRHPRYKLHYDRLTKKSQLYDLIEDPNEGNDVADIHPAMAGLLMQRLMEFMSIERSGKRLPSLSPQEIEKLRSLGYL